MIILKTIKIFHSETKMIISAKNRGNSFGSPIPINYLKLILDFLNFKYLLDPEVEELDSKFLHQ